MSTDLNKSQFYPVWVGQLTESVTESVLMSHFKRFGPIRNVVVVKDPITRKSKLFAYVNYHNHEVADVAAQEMNGVEINGRKIRTKGPKKQFQATPLVSPVEKKDVNALTDCQYYILKGDCTPKSGQVCQYRHFERARHTKEVCEKWSDKSCMKKNCAKRHPKDMKHKPSTLHDVSLVRCDSHNAYKCYNQCGVKECNTHFQNEQDLIDHVLSSKQPYSPCEVCNAVFFDIKEKESHCHKNEKKKESSSSEKSSSFYNSGSEPIGVFWDIENCRVPRGRSAIAVVNKLREKFYPGRREVEFMCVCDTTKEKKEILEELNKAQINIVHINATSKNAADDKLKQALRRFAQAHMPPATIVLVSGDINFASELSDLRHRHNMRVVLIHNKQASAALMNCAHECMCFENFTSGLPLSTHSTQVHASNEVLITNLPSGPKHFVHKIKSRLNTLACNTGGKVISISPFDGKSKDNVAVIRFADVDAAQRAVQRLDKEDVFGSEIRATFYSVKKVNNKDSSMEKEQSVKKTPGKNNTPLKNKQNLDDNQKEKNKELQASSNDAKKPKNFSSHPSNTNQPLPTNLLENNDFLTDFTRFTQLKENAPSLQSNLHENVLSTFSWTQVANNLVQNTIQNSSSVNGIDVLVTNLDDSVSVKDLKKKLTSLAREHTKVTNVVIAGHGKDSNLHAFIKVPRIQDAQLCITKLNNVMLFKKRIRLNFASAKENTILKMKSEVSAILLETYSGWLPLNDFLASFKERHQHAFHVLNFDQIKDLIYVDGVPGHQFVCLLHFPVGLLKIKFDDNFKEDLSYILKTHNRRIPFSSIPGLYWSYLKKEIPVSETGELLFKLVLMNNDISLLGNAPAQQAVFYKRRRPEKGVADLQNIRDDITALLKVSPGFSVFVTKFIPLYHQYFGRQCCIADYGYKDLEEMFDAMSDLLLVSDSVDGRTISFTQQFRNNLIDRDLTELLFSREKHKLPVSSLITAYYRFFGHKMYFQNFGFNSLASMVTSLSKKKFKVTGCGDGKMLVLCHQKPKNHQKALQLFANEVASLIQNQPDKRLGLHNLSSEYYKHYGKQLKLADLGFAKLNDLVAAISDFVEISGSRDRKTLYISDDHPNPELLWSEVETLLGYSSEKALLILLLPDFYKDRFLKPFPLDAVKMNHFFKKLPNNMVSAGRGSHTIIFDLNPEKYPSKLLLEHISELLYTCDHFKATIQNLSDLLKTAHDISVTASRILLEVQNNENFQVTRERVVQLTHITARKLFEYEIVTILQDQTSKQIFLPQLVKLYTKQFSKTIKVNDFGVPKLQSLLEKLTPGIAQITYVNSHPCVSLGPLGRLYSECKAVLEDNNGALLLCNFAPEYQRKFNKQLRAVDFGYQKIGDLVESLSGALKVYGEKNMKVVVMKEKLLNPQSGEDMSNSNESDSDSDDVVIESEEFEADEKIADENMDIQDLLQFTEDEKPAGSPTDLIEWWMEPVPDLPPPTLKPAVLPDESKISYDLITFSEFDSCEVRNGGLNNVPVISYSNPFSSSKSLMSTTSSKNDSDDFADTLFSTGYIPTTSAQHAVPEEPDLMRLLLGRCSPLGFTAPPPLPIQATTNDSSTSLSSVSDTYSCFSALENIGRNTTARQGESYVGALHDIFSQQVHVKTQKPRIAANFNHI